MLLLCVHYATGICALQTQKTNSQFRPEDTKVHHVTRYEMSRKEREFDPVLQYWRDNKRVSQRSVVLPVHEPDSLTRHLSLQEQNTRNMETTNLRQTLNRARDKQMRYTQTFDIITHVPKVEEPPAKPRAPPAPSTRTQFNIISNLDFAHHHYTKPSERPPPAPASSRKPPGVTVKGRDYNIISNKYDQPMPAPHLPRCCVTLIGWCCCVLCAGMW